MRRLQLNPAKTKIADCRRVKNRVRLFCRQGPQLFPQICRGRELLDPLRSAFAPVRGLGADQQDHLMAAGDQEIGQFRAEAAGGKICEPAHVVERFISRTGSDDTVHATKIACKESQMHKNFVLSLFSWSAFAREQNRRHRSGHHQFTRCHGGFGHPAGHRGCQRPAAHAVRCAFSVADGAPIVGYEANRVRLIKPAETVYSVKRFIGRRGADISQEEILVTYPVQASGTGAVAFPIHGKNFSPEEVSTEVLKKLKRDAENYFGEPVTRAVITVPAYFNDAQRNATKRAGELAGFTVERIVNEPTAAALAYGLDRLKEKSKIAVYDLGGGTFDLSILELNDGVFQVLATNGNTRLGGDDLDKRLVDFLVEKIETAHPPFAIPNPQSLSRIREAAERAKIKLSTETEVEITLPFLTPDFSFSCRLTRAELENLTRDIIARTRPHCLRALADAKVEPKDLDQVILVGGQTRMPLVRQFVSELFGCAEFEETRGDVRLGSYFHKAARPAAEHVPESR